MSVSLFPLATRWKARVGGEEEERSDEVAGPLRCPLCALRDSDGGRAPPDRARSGRRWGGRPWISSPERSGCGPSNDAPSTRGSSILRVVCLSVMGGYDA